MRPLPYLILAAAITTPLSAHAQVDAQRQALEAQQRSLANQQRMIDAQRSLDTYTLNQKFDEQRLRTDNIESQLRTNQNMSDLQTQRATIPPLSTAPLIAAAAPATPKDLADAEARREASIAASEARLKALAAQVNR